MTRIVFTLFCLLLFLQGFAQHRVGLSASVDATNAFRFASLDGGSSSDGGTSYSLALSYWLPLNNPWNLQTGLGYLHARHTIIPNTPPDEVVPDWEVQRSLISIPFVFRRYFGSHTTRLYVDFGSSIDFERDVPEELDNNSGLSLFFSPGLEQQLGNTFSLNLAPQFQLHSLIPFQKETYHQRLIAAGVALSLLYSLD